MNEVLDTYDFIYNHGIVTIIWMDLSVNEKCYFRNNSGNSF